MFKKLPLAIVTAVLIWVSASEAVVKVTRSPVSSPYISCQGSLAAVRIPFSAEDMPAKAFLKFLALNGFSWGIKGGNLNLDKITFTFLPKETPTICEIVSAFAQAADVYAEIKGRKIIFSSHVILSYVLPFPVGSISRSVSFSGSGGSLSTPATPNGESTASGGGVSGGMGGGGAQSSSSYELTFWDNLEKGLALILGQTVESSSPSSPDIGLEAPVLEKGESVPQGGFLFGGFSEVSQSNGKIYWADRATGTLFIRVRPSLVQDVDQFVQKLIEKYSRVIRVRIVLYELVEDRGSYYKSSWQQAIRNFINANWKIWGEGSPTNFPPNESLWSLGYEGFSKDESGRALSYGILSILRKYGKARLVDRAVVYLSNGYTAEIARGEHREYVSSFTRTVMEGGVSTSVSKGVIMSGVRFSLRGHVLDDVSWDGPPSVFLSVFSNIVRLESLTTFDTGDGYIQNPAYSGKSSFLTFVVPRGRPIILVALDSQESSKHRSGFPLLDFVLGSRSKVDAKRTLIMILFPEIIDVTRAWGAL